MTPLFTIDRAATAGDMRARFEEFGVVVVKGLMAKDHVSEQRDAVRRLIAIRLRGLGGVTGADIDDDMAALLSIGREHAMDIIRAIKDSPFFFAALADRRLQAVARACLDCETLLAVHDIAQFRIDPPNDDARNFPWHQDFQYNVTSLDAVTFWCLLTDVTVDMGPLVVVPGSHREIADVAMDFGTHKPGSGSMHGVMRFEIDADKAERGAVMLREIEAGDVVAFHSLLIHRSSANRSTRSRWTLNPRFSDAADSRFAGRGWLAVRDKTQDVFGRYYPEHIRR